MSAILTASAMYVVLVILFRCAGKRTLQQITVFDVVLLLIISEATQQALVGNDGSLTQALTIVTTLVMIDVGFSVLKNRSQPFERLVDGLPLVIVEDGVPLRDRMRGSRVGEDDVLEAARQIHGLERMEQIRYAVLERDGRISIVPAR